MLACGLLFSCFTPALMQILAPNRFCFDYYRVLEIDGPFGWMWDCGGGGDGDALPFVVLMIAFLLI